jgi:hypothetical protein
MRFTYTVTVDVQRTEGKFATKDELGDQLQEALEGADPGSLTGDNGGEYSVDGWDVERTDG